jgi:hypothetical protein
MKKEMLFGALLVSAGVASADTFVIDVSSWQTFGDYNDTNNSSVIANLGTGSVINSVTWDNVSFDTIGASWISEVVFEVGVNLPANNLVDYDYFAFQFDAATDAPGTYSGGGSFSPVDGLTVGADGLAIFYVWETFTDNAGTGDANFTSGTITIDYTPIPAPGAVAAFGVAGLAGLRRRR